MSFGTTLCLNARVNFAPGHVEAADLFEARDDQGRLHAVMVPDVCGNVTVLGAQRAGGVVAGVSGALADRALALVAVAEALAMAPADPGTAMLGDAPAGEGRASQTPDLARPASTAPSAAEPAAAGDRPDGPEAPDSEPPGTGSPRGPGPLAGASGGQAGGVGPGQAEPPAARRGGGQPGWAGPVGGGWSRPVLVAGLNGSAAVLARASTTIAALTVPAGEPGGGGGGTSTRQNSLQPQAVPEPGTLLSVLAALAALAWVGSRRK